jgi:hypothetical protein
MTTTSEAPVQYSPSAEALAAVMARPNGGADAGRNGGGDAGIEATR